MSFPANTTGLGTAARIIVEGNKLPLSTVPGNNKVIVSLSGANGPTSFQLSPEVADVSGAALPLGTPLVLTAVAAATPGELALTAAAAAVGNTTLYTGTITGGASNAFVGFEFTVAGFDLAPNNGNFACVASTATTLTLANAAGVVDTHAATATTLQGSAVYTGTITGGASNALAGKPFNVAGFVNASNNGSFIATASSATTLTLENNFTIAETHAATATGEDTTLNLTYYADGAASYTTGTSGLIPSPPTVGKVVTVSATGLVTTNGVRGKSNVEISYPVFNNTAGTITVGGKALPAQKVYADVEVIVLA